jgi:hypothetical protein
MLDISIKAIYAKTGELRAFETLDEFSSKIWPEPWGLGSVIYAHERIDAVFGLQMVHALMHDISASSGLAPIFHLAGFSDAVVLVRGEPQIAVRYSNLVSDAVSGSPIVVSGEGAKAAFEEFGKRDS